MRSAFATNRPTLRLEKRDLALSSRLARVDENISQIAAFPLFGFLISLGHLIIHHRNEMPELSKILLVPMFVLYSYGIVSTCNAVPDTVGAARAGPAGAGPQGRNQQGVSP